ncbi:hypothetical protein FRC12_015105 [Ceratobasidium sp. 428]|nr:hypothetical protein FRC12_015105 [Ceratobasidium sp. 428]
MAGSKVGQSRSVARGGSSGQPAQKKARTTKASTAGPKKRGKLSFAQFLDLPVEVIGEIVKHLMPADLLSLARSNRFLRKIFMSRTSQALWKATIRDVPNMPECPSGFSEPEYISLLYTKICSVGATSFFVYIVFIITAQTCGAKVLRRMDPYLLARLCNACSKETTRVIFPHDPLYELVVRSPMMGGIELYSTVFDDDMAYVQQASSRHGPGSKWFQARKAAIDKRQKYGQKLQKFLDSLDKEKAAEIVGVKERRQQDIKARIIAKGWDARDMKPAPEDCYAWDQLVDQPKPLTNRTWANLYPKLLPLLESNHEYHQRIDRMKRKRGRHDMFHDMVYKMRKGVPPVVRVTVKHPSQVDDPGSNATSVSGASTPSSRDIKIETLFPSDDELLRWPMLKRILRNDMSTEEARIKLEEIWDEIEQAIVEWRENVEQDLIEIWNAEEAEAEPALSTSKVDGKGTGRNVQRGNGHTTISNSNSHTVPFDLPEFIVTFGRPDGTTTTELPSLSPGMQLLLRADTIFKGHDVCHHYPTLVPHASCFGSFSGSRAQSERNHRGRWKAKRIGRDNEASAVARKLLAQIGRPDATSAETQAFGARFQCDRCTGGSPITWDRLVQHYTQEQRQWKQALEKIPPSSKIIYRNTHELGPGDPRPFARLVAPQSGHSYHHTKPMMECIWCEKVGILSHYEHVKPSEGNVQSPLTGHLKNVHGIANPEQDVHFRKWRSELRYRANHVDSDTEDENEDEEDYDEDEGYDEEEELCAYEQYYGDGSEQGYSEESLEDYGEESVDMGDLTD